MLADGRWSLARPQHKVELLKPRGLALGTVRTVPWRHLAEPCTVRAAIVKRPLPADLNFVPSSAIAALTGPSPRRLSHRHRAISAGSPELIFGIGTGESCGRRLPLGVRVSRRA